MIHRIYLRISRFRDRSRFVRIKKSVMRPTEKSNLKQGTKRSVLRPKEKSVVKLGKEKVSDSA